MGIDRVRWGIVATGNISTSFTKDLALLADDAVVTAVASRSMESATRFADQFGIEHRYDDWRRLLDDGVVDVLYIGTPHPQHYAVARAALQAKVAVLCEKPVTLTARQARDLVAVAVENNTLFAEAMWMRTNPVIQAFFADLGKGVIGEPMEALADFGFYKANPPARLLDHALGGGSLMDGGIYPMTFVHMALGKPAEVKAVGSLNDDGVDLNVAMAWRYDSGAVAALTCGLRSQNPFTASVSGPEGSLVAPEPLPPSRVLRAQYGLRPGAGRGTGAWPWVPLRSSRGDAGVARGAGRMPRPPARCHDRDPRVARRDT